jgi:hypothetical protein
MATARTRRHPEVVIVGVKRGGTTSLFRDLEHHPSMLPLVPSANRLPLRENMKGVHYYDTGVARSDRWYRSHFATQKTRDRRTRISGSAFTAEASPYYFFHPLGARRAVLGLPEETVFVVLLRDPVERTVSHWAEQTRNGIETLSLADAIDAEADRLGNAAQQLASGTLIHSNAHEQQSYVSQSMYANSLQRWFDSAGRDRIIVLFSEDYYRDARSSVDCVTDRLGVPRSPHDPGEHRNAAQRAGSLNTDLDASLTRLFQPDVDRLATMLETTPPWPRFLGTP